MFCEKSPVIQGVYYATKQWTQALFCVILIRMNTACIFFRGHKRNKVYDITKYKFRRKTKGEKR